MQRHEIVKGILDRDCFDKNDQGRKCDFYKRQKHSLSTPCFCCHKHDKLAAEITDAVIGVVYA